METRDMLVWLAENGMPSLQYRVWYITGPLNGWTWAHTVPHCTHLHGECRKVRTHVAGLAEVNALPCLQCIEHLDGDGTRPRPGFLLEIARLRINLAWLTALTTEPTIDRAGRYPSLRAALIAAAWETTVAAKTLQDPAPVLQEATSALLALWEEARERYPLNWAAFDAELKGYAAEDLANIETRWNLDTETYLAEIEQARTRNLADTRRRICYVGSIPRGLQEGSLSIRTIAVARGVRTEPIPGAVSHCGFAEYPSVVAKWLTMKTVDRLLGEPRASTEGGAVITLESDHLEITPEQFQIALTLWEDSFRGVEHGDTDPMRDMNEALAAAANL